MGSLRGTTSPGQIGTGRNGNEGVQLTPQSFGAYYQMQFSVINRTPFLGLGVTYSSAEVAFNVF